MRVKTKRKRGRDPLVVVYFAKAKNFWLSDLSWAPTKEEISEIVWAMKRVGAWE